MKSCHRWDNRCQQSLKSVILSNIKSAPSSARILLGSGPVLTATVNIAAACAALTPSGAFSTTTASHGFTPALASPLI